MIKPNHSRNRDREDSLLPMEARCDDVDCDQRVVIRPADEEQALDLSDEALPSQWIKTYLEARRWATRSNRTYCPAHTASLLDEQVDDEADIIDDDNMVDGHFEQFFIDEIIDDPDGKVEYAEAYSRYCRWANKNLVPARRKRSFGKALRADGRILKVTGVRRNGRATSAYCVLGIALREDTEYASGPEELPVSPSTREFLTEEDFEMCRLQIQLLELREYTKHMIDKIVEEN